MGNRGHREDIIRTKFFFRELHPRSYSQLIYLGAEQQAGRRAHGRTYSAAAVFVENTAEAEITLAIGISGDGGSRFCLDQDPMIRSASQQSL